MCVCLESVSVTSKQFLKIETCISSYIVVMGICTDCTVMCTITKCNFKVQIV